MKFDRVAILLTPRTTCSCLDLAVCFIRRHVRPVLALWALIALPSTLVVYYLADVISPSDYDLRLALVVIYFASSPLGVLLILGAAPSTFGEPFTWAQVARICCSGRGILDLIKGTMLRCVIGLGLLPFFVTDHLSDYPMIGALVMLIPAGGLIALRTGFFAEKSSLLQINQRLHGKRTRDLLKKQTLWLLLRGCWIVAFTGLLSIVLLVSIDLGGGGCCSGIPSCLVDTMSLSMGQASPSECCTINACWPL